MRRTLLFFIVSLFVANILFPHRVNGQAYCNPMNLSYRFSLSAPSSREAADPTVVLFKDTYFLFASKSGGYWYSSDLLKWNFLTTTVLPLENYAPTAVVIDSLLYFFTSGSNTIFRSSDPASGKWEVFNSSFPISDTDPSLFADTDGRVYLYYGCSDSSPIKAVELDVNNKLNPKGSPVNCFSGNPEEHGWEKPGDYNEQSGNPWIEGSWMNKYNGKYYLQYASPGTQFKSYADGVYVSDNPLGPFTYASNNPFSAKPEGFIDGAGHGSTFADKYGNWWHIATMSISVKDQFERRLGMFPAGFDSDGNLFTYNDFGDYPLIIPSKKYSNVSELFPGWMLLSYGKKAEASSALVANPVTFAFDENVRTYWSALTGNKGEWLSVDLDSLCTVHAVQVNFAENNTQLYGRNNILSEQYLIEYSTDKQTWKTLIDKTTNAEDLTHQFHVINSPVKARYLRVTNYRVPSGTFAISDFRVFGTNTGMAPSKVTSFNTLRTGKDSRTIKLLWRRKQNATGYNVRYGSQKDRLYHSYLVYNDTTLTIRSLNAGQVYWFEIDAFGENGLTLGDSGEGTITPEDAVIEAENFSLKSGVQTENCSEGGSDVAWIDSGDYTCYNNIDFGAGVSTLDARVASNSAVGTTSPGAIDIRKNGLKGPLLGTIDVPGTGGWQNWTTVSCNLTGATGIQNVYLVYRKSGFNLNWIQLKSNTGNLVMLYQNTGYTGWSAGFGIGSYTTADIEAAGGINNDASSIQIPSGWKAVLYDGDNFSGTSISVISDNPNLLVNDFLYKVSSIIVSGQTTSGVGQTLEEKRIMVYPNPANDLLFIDGIPGNTCVTFSNMLGQIVVKVRTSQAAVDVSKLTSGIYFMQVDGCEGKVFKIMKH